MDAKSDVHAYFSASDFDVTKLPDYDREFVSEDDITAFTNALNAPETSPSQDDLTSLEPGATHPLFITALNDWKPVRQRVRRKRRGTDETREGYLYSLLKWPLLFFVFAWILLLGTSYLFTRFYIFMYEHWVTWRGKRNKLRRSLREVASYEEWVLAATKLDAHLGNDRWKTIEEYAYYDHKTIERVRNKMMKYRKALETGEELPVSLTKHSGQKPVEELRALAEASVRDNFAGFENPRLYSETYYGTKELVQSFIEEAEASLTTLKDTTQLDSETKRAMWKHMQTNFGRTALCLSGGATFAYYHFGVAKALLDADLLPQVITGTSGGALIAALLATRTNDELQKLLVPALAHRITACEDSTWTWLKRWWRTGARFDSVAWARKCSWFTRGSMTFREAYKRTGRILNVSCVPSDPHSPAILANYLTSPDCVIWSAVLASAAVPGVLNPVVLMKKTKDGRLEPYSFGHKWKDGSLRTDIPLKALNLHFNVNFSIVSQVNPHINLFFFSSRGSVGRPVTHRKGRGWRGGFLGSAAEQYLKLDLNKWLKVLRHLELLPRPLGQDWSQLWLQRFSGTVTIWPKSDPIDFWHILSDPTPERLARMIRVGQLSTWPKLKFIANRARLERLIAQGRRASRPPAMTAAATTAAGSGGELFSDDDIQRFLESNSAGRRHREKQATKEPDADGDAPAVAVKRAEVPPITIPSPPTLQAVALQQTADARAPASGSPSLGSRLRHFFSRRRSAAGSGHPPTLSRAKSASTASSASSASLPSMAQQQQPLLEEQLQQSPRPLERRTSSGLFGSSRRGSRRGSILREVERQTSVFFEDSDSDAASASGSDAGAALAETMATTAADGRMDSAMDGNPARINGAHDSDSDELMMKAVGPTIIGL
jgi:predicted acylesterase/phospholipase RssA